MRRSVVGLCLLTTFVIAAGSPFGCAEGSGGQGGSGAAGAGPSSSSSGSGVDASADAPTDGPIPDGTCPTTFSFVLPQGASGPKIAGEWQGFDLATAPSMTGPGADGAYSVTVPLQPGLWAYKVVYDQGGSAQWVLDPSQGRRKYVGGVENSAVKVRNCALPTWTVSASQAARPMPGKGTFTASLGYVDGLGAGGPDTAGFVATLRHDGADTPLTAPSITIAPSGDVTLALSDLEDGKYRITLTPKAQNGAAGEPVFLPFWIEAEAFSWQDALIYMIVTDRYRDGDGQSPPPTPNADPRGDFKGGDLEGVRQSIADGTLDALGVRALWLTPFNQNPVGAYLASDGIHQVTGYHGYWPIKAREVDPRIGGAAALKALVDEAHQHGIRVLMDFVVNHVHQDHEYVAAHPDWFRTGCVCGTSNCDWTAHALDCMFASYLPDVNHSVPEANAAFVSDAVYWLDTFDLDGLRVDAVKHVEEVATRNLAAEVRETFERAKTRYFLMGETAMGWSDCADPCNDENYGTISRYVGPFGLDGQFDFVLYHGVSYRTFAWGDKGMLHADYWFSHGDQKWPPGAIMTPYIGSHDTPRFLTHADYRGQDAAHARDIPGSQWDNTAGPPNAGDQEPFRRARVALAWLLGLPGAPLLYYGDEYGQWGGADPNNRLMWRPQNQLSSDEQATLAFTKSLGAARRAIPALRRGAYTSLYATEDTLVIGRFVAAGNAAIMAFTRSGAPVTATFDVAAKLGLASGTVLHNALGGPAVTVTNGQVTYTIPAYGAAILAP